MSTERSDLAKAARALVDHLYSTMGVGYNMHERQRLVHDARVALEAVERVEAAERAPAPKPTTTFPPDRFLKAARYLLDVLQGRKDRSWTIDDAVEAARQAGLGTVNMEAAITTLLADGIIVKLPRRPGAIMLTETGSNYYNAWRFVNPRDAVGGRGY